MTMHDNMTRPGSGNDRRTDENFGTSQPVRADLHPAETRRSDARMGDGRMDDGRTGDMRTSAVHQAQGIRPSETPDIRLEDGALRRLDYLGAFAVSAMLLLPLATAAFGPIN
jgi:hypothetical protein